MAENLQQREVIRKKLELSLCSAPFYGQCELYFLWPSQTPSFFSPLKDTTGSSISDKNIQL
jgi:hypothetical protein